MKRFLIKHAGQPFGTLEVAEVVESPDSPDYTLRDEQGKLLGIFTTAPGITVVESESPTPKED
jgi:hypothetical protein